MFTLGNVLTSRTMESMMFSSTDLPGGHMALIIRNATGELRLDKEHDSVVATLTPRQGESATMALTQHDLEVLIGAAKAAHR